MRHIVKDVECNCGIFRVGESEPIVILNNLRNALLIARILDKDCSVNPNIDPNYVFTDADYYKFCAELRACYKIKEEVDNE